MRQKCESEGQMTFLPTVSEAVIQAELVEENDLIINVTSYVSDQWVFIWPEQTTSLDQKSTKSWNKFEIKLIATQNEWC